MFLALSALPLSATADWGLYSGIYNCDTKADRLTVQVKLLYDGDAGYGITNIDDLSVTYVPEEIVERIEGKAPKPQPIRKHCELSSGTYGISLSEWSDLPFVTISRGDKNLLRRPLEVCFPAREKSDSVKLDGKLGTPAFIRADCKHKYQQYNDAFWQQHANDP